jgi:Asp-tRNA(Asn)/Glu-tRNA(Gln) amidotransferase A subunit family amidase
MRWSNIRSHSTPGYVSWIGKYADRNAVLVDILLEAGAVPFVRTNVPQTLMVRPDVFMSSPA